MIKNGFQLSSVLNQVCALIHSGSAEIIWLCAVRYVKGEDFFEQLKRHLSKYKYCKVLSCLWETSFHSMRDCASIDERVRHNSSSFSDLFSIITLRSPTTRPLWIYFSWLVSTDDKQIQEHRARRTARPQTCQMRHPIAKEIHSVLE